MGLGGLFLRDLIELKASNALNGARRVAEIGDQQLSDTLINSSELRHAYSLFGCIELPVFNAIGQDDFAASAPSSAAFWHALGLERTAIDLVGNTVKIDLNRGRVPFRLRRAFDLVVNAGTTEHVANQANAFRVIHDLCRKGGIMYHELPAGGLINHGLISYEPKFFYRLAEANDYEPIFIRYWTHGNAPVPDHLRSQCTPSGEVVMCALRVALRKRNNLSFVCPMDAECDARTFSQKAAAALLRRTAFISRIRAQAVRGLRTVKGWSFHAE